MLKNWYLAEPGPDKGAMGNILRRYLAKARSALWGERPRHEEGAAIGGDSGVLLLSKKVTRRRLIHPTGPGAGPGLTKPERAECSSTPQYTYASLGFFAVESFHQASFIVADRKFAACNYLTFHWGVLSRNKKVGTRRGTRTITEPDTAAG